LPSDALGKGFAECNLAFVECLRHSAKNMNPVVIELIMILRRQKLSCTATCVIIKRVA